MLDEEVTHWDMCYNVGKEQHRTTKTLIVEKRVRALICMRRRQVFIKEIKISHLVDTMYAHVEISHGTY